MAYFCTKTGARLIAPGIVGEVPEHDGSAAADAAEHAARGHIVGHFERLHIGTPADKPAPDPVLSAEAAKVAVEALAKAKQAPAKPAADKPSGK